MRVYNCCKVSSNTKGNAVEYGKFYLKYISITGTFPMKNVWNKRRVYFIWTSWQVAYTIGLIVYVSNYGAMKIATNLFKNESFEFINTDDLVTLSAILTTPFIATIAMIGMLCKSKTMADFMKKWHRFPQPQKPHKNLVLLSLSMALCIAVASLGKGPDIFNTNVGEPSSAKTVSDTLFWIIIAPSITTPSILYTHVVRSVATGYQELRDDCVSFMKNETPGKICKHIPILSRSESVAAFQKRFEQLTHILKLANEVLSPYLLITLLYYAIELCMYLYELVIILLFRENLGLKHQIIIVMLFCILFLYLLLTTVEGAQFLQDQGEDCLDELSKCSNFTSNDQEYNSFLSFLIKSYARPPTCQASSYFTINRASFVAVMSAILTFIIILVQFKKSEKPQ